jgi:hypothetical protein
LTATPFDGYIIKGWTDNDITINSANTKFTIPYFDESHDVIVEFEPVSYLVTFFVENGNGALEAMVGGSPVTSAAQVRKGENVEFTAKPEDGYRVKDWKIDDEPVSDYDLDVFILQNLSDDVKVTVEFESESYPVSFTVVDANGTLEALVNGMVNIASGTPVPYDRTIVFTATANSGYRIKEWKCNDAIQPDNSPSFTMVVKEPTHVTVEFILVKGMGANVSAPTKRSTTLSSITVNAVTPPDNGQTVEYAISSEIKTDATELTWQDDVTFNGLTAYTTYYVYARSKENEDYLSGAPSVSAALTTEDTLNSGEDRIVNPLKAYIHGGRMYVRGLTEGKLWNVYSVSGALIYRGMATANEMEISLNTQGRYIIQQEERTVKVVNYGQ